MLCVCNKEEQQVDFPVINGIRVQLYNDFNLVSANCLFCICLFRKLTSKLEFEGGQRKRWVRMGTSLYASSDRCCLFSKA